MIPVIYHPIYSELSLPPKHRYPITKYRRLYENVVETLEHDAQWREGLSFVEPTALSTEQVLEVHDEEYIQLLFSGEMPAAKMRRIGFPWSEQLITRTLTSAGGTVETAKQAIEHGIALHLSGGYHHAHKDFGSGFCLINDLVLAAHEALKNENIDKVLIVDADVHHGDGTATLCEDRCDIITLSFHCDKNFPARKPTSDMDVPLAREIGDEEFLSSFKQVVEMAINIHQPDLIIYDAGVDIHTDDELGYLQVSAEGIYQRDHFIFLTAKNAGIPIASVVGGGYRTEHQDLVPIHRLLIQAAINVFKDD
ncbi:putative Histone deacetylase [Vibrio nigripulchritudo SO65]|uniref:histone deacetylase family protein n=1 Tax=Vibrio nigripulchritudo TaxID=28173 RepID=UPI0003B180CD|nr:histone deacetylase [Vibrio nigripulchritudo]CCN33107.1 putative Histone deacetylase [Vibrio nigripulchritudo AM115]CCN41204.1 putative Histone deacetylase [Vibrio nigripulchritudo FTn2]CCN67976.1 putative Histone deacetylase [Vibrio nigripulchritudo POn4]CCN78262.1 putative Histone deacetylase [Vibrio nigripulchritudo SO65]